MKESWEVAFVLLEATVEGAEVFCARIRHERDWAASLFLRRATNLLGGRVGLFAELYDLF